MPEEAARANLRLTLSKLRKTLPETILSITRAEVGLVDFWLDVAVFSERFGIGDWRLKESLTSQSQVVDLQASLELYRGDFLDGFQLSTAPDFEEWAQAQRPRLRQTAVTGLSKWLDTAVQQNDYESGLAIAQKLLTIEPWHEESQRQLMKLLALNGQRTDALAQYETCRRLLAAELGVEPSAETTALYQQIKNDTVTTARSPIHVSTSAPYHPSPHNLPTQLTPFIGRKAEITHLRKQLLDPNCRLLTIMGIGGMGKTRLALEVAAQAAPHFSDGIIFVDLSPLTAADLWVTAVTDALSLSLNRSTSPYTQLTQFLAGRQLLLLLDNFETVLDSATALADLLTQATQLTILATSREPLNLHGEWLYPLAGLALPQADSDEEAHMAEALDFFVGCARRLVPQFSAQGEMADIVELCRLTAGMPLALELAASWVKTLTVAEIVTEIQQNLDILAARQSNRPERQRSIEAVLNQTWQRMASAEQDTFARLCVFQGAFERQVAQAVAGANIGTLTSLLDKALLQRRQSGSYSIHPLVRQFGTGRLQTKPDLWQQTQQVYAASYADFCQQRLRPLRQRDLVVLAELKQAQ